MAATDSSLNYRPDGGAQVAASVQDGKYYQIVQLVGKDDGGNLREIPVTPEGHI